MTARQPSSGRRPTGITHRRTPRGQPGQKSQGPQLTRTNSPESGGCSCGGPGVPSDPAGSRCGRTLRVDGRHPAGAWCPDSPVPWPISCLHLRSLRSAGHGICLPRGRSCPSAHFAGRCRLKCPAPERLGRSRQKLRVRPPSAASNKGHFWTSKERVRPIRRRTSMPISGWKEDDAPLTGKRFLRRRSIRGRSPLW